MPTIPRRPSARPESDLRATVSRNAPIAKSGSLQSIPRKSSLPSERNTPAIPKVTLKLSRLSPAQQQQSRSSFIQVDSERPFIIKIKTRGIPLDVGIPDRPKRKRPTYQELEDTDSEDFMDTEEEEEVVEKRKSKRKTSKSPSMVNMDEDVELPSSSVAIATSTVEPQLQLLADPVVVDAPPPGVLPNLWYSREEVLHLWVMEKVLGWRTRPMVSLEWSDPNAVKCMDQVEANAISAKALASEDLWQSPTKRMEVSRINPMQCPMVLHLAAMKEKARAQRECREPRYKVDSSSAESKMEEVFLVKWRGRSYMHTSWERKKDLEKFDQSNNTARGKIRRYILAQEVAYGKDWKQILGSGGGLVSQEESPVPGAEDELFPPQFLEVERLLACDESEMNMNIFAKQRALNMREEEKALRKLEKEEAEGVVHLHKTGIYEDLPQLSDGEDPWDPEDNVRYVVKWKGLQYSEMTWEYWINIKRDAVTQAEDFWIRQQAPDPEEILKLPGHPHMRDFRKLVESPAFGVSKVPRPTADLGDGFIVEDDDEKEEREFKLRSYQLEGVNWLLFNWWNKRSCILADEMGLGKTIQSTGFLHQLHALPQTRVRGPFLIVAPLSLIGQWQSESQTWAPDLNVVFYHGSADAREFIAKHEFYYSDQFIPKQTAARLKKMHVTKFHILITTYEVVLKDVDVLKKIRWKALIVDEAHRLKNPKARLFEELASVPRDFCILLTGTPLQNSTEELWALLYFSDPITFKSKEDFIEKFGELSDAKQVSDLHTVLKPYLLRRVKEDVEKSLPPKEETILEVTLTPIQKKYYKAIYERNTAFLFKGSKPSNAPSLMNVMMELRKACNHPFLIRGAEERIVDDAIVSLKEKAEESGTESMIEPMKIFGEQLIKSSGKFVLLAKLLPKLYSGGHKVLIFSQMVKVLDLLEELLKWKKYRYERLDGSTNATSRVSAVDRFIRKACQRFVMLLSTRAGGLGLNLTAADTVIIFDSDWNPQNDLQAMARSHRIGQTRPVRVYRLLTAKTYEMHMFHSASMKLGLDRAVLAHQRQQDGDDGDGTSKKKDKESQAKEIDALLKKGAYDVFRDDDDNEAQKFMETDIDQLLEQSAKKVTYGTANTSISSGLGSFSKASFVTDTGDGDKDVDLDDPDFWAKAVGLAAPVETPEEIAQMIDDGVKRSRKQVQVYDPFADMNEAEQKKKDKIAQKARDEKEERERQRLERRLRKVEDNGNHPKKKKDRDSASVSSSPTNVDLLEDATPKPKKIKKSERSKAQRRAENEDPMLERLKQAWDVPQRNRGSSSLLRFGFGRFCKLRSDSNLTSLPLQDLEVFVRAYLFQIALQVAVSIMKKLRAKGSTSKSIKDIAEGDLRTVVSYWLGNSSEKEASWICESVCSAASLYTDIESCSRFLRMPLSLADSAYVSALRKGPALRALRRVGIIDRLNSIIDDVVNEVIASLGPEEMGRRGCLIRDYSTMDTDSKCRHLTSEELVLGLGARLDARAEQRSAPAVWWNRSCDLGLIVGSFVHGFGNYESMRSDEELPFASLMGAHSALDVGCASAGRCFIAATMIARKVFDEALESSKAKAQLEAHAAVAAAVAATKKAHAEGASDDIIKDATAGVTDAVNELDVEADDLHMVTLTRLNRKIGEAHRSCLRQETVPGLELDVKQGDLLPLPDPRVLDLRLLELVELIETRSVPKSTSTQPISSLIADQPEPVASSHQILELSCKRFNFVPAEFGREFNGIGLSGNQCGSTHRSLDDGSDYAVGSASPDLNFIATGNDGPRYLRALGVPINITRYAIVSVANADRKIVEKMLGNEKDRNFGKKLEQKRERKIIEVKAENSRNDGVDKMEGAPSKEEFEVLETIPAVIPQESIPPAIRENAKLRASICAVALHYGCPAGMPFGGSISEFIVHSLQEHTPYSPAVSSLFTFTTFTEKVKVLSGTVDFPSERDVHDYVQNILLPHCLRISVYGNGPTTRHTRVSKGTFETAQGLSLYPEPFGPSQTPLPDPTLGAAEHSIEAVLSGCAILRRVRLLRAAQYAVSGALSWDQLCGIFTSLILRQSMSDLPLWWNPCVHDLALLVSVASGGIFNVFQNREGTVFDKRGVIEEQVKSISKSVAGTRHDIDAFVEDNCADFPSPNVLERRLALLCSEATKHLNDETFYMHLPMFDHGGWPRN